MKLLSVHLSLAHAGGTGALVLGTQGRPLRNLLFRLIDSNMPDSIQQVSTVYLKKKERKKVFCYEKIMFFACLFYI